jgi:integrase
VATKKRRKSEAGLGSFVQRGDNGYLVYRDHTGRQRWVSGVRSRQEAIALRQAIREKEESGRTRELEDHAFGPYVERWLTLKGAGGTASQQTVAGYRDIVEGHFLPVWANEPLGRIDSEQIQVYVAAKLQGQGAVGGRSQQQLSPQTVRNHLGLLRQILQAATRDGYRSGLNPVDDVERPRVDHEPQYLTTRQFEKLLAAVPTEYRLLTLTLKELGLRLGEAQALTWDDYDETTHTLRVRHALKRTGVGPPKSKHGRRALRVSEGFHALLMDHKRALGDRVEPLNLIFPNRRGKHFNQSNYRNRVFKPALAAAGLPTTYRVHDLRHTHAAQAIARNINPKQLSRRLGHHSVRFTLDTYGGLYEEQENEPADSLPPLAQSV